MIPNVVPTVLERVRPAEVISAGRLDAARIRFLRAVHRADLDELADRAEEELRGAL